MKKLLPLYLLAGVLVAWSAYAEPTRTVDWYRKHATERTALLKECRNNPGELAQTPNCVNAERADSLAEAAKTGTIDFEAIRTHDWGPTPWRLDNPPKRK